jgi:hypothetical protein
MSKKNPFIPLREGDEQKEIRTWDDMPEHVREGLKARMPQEVQEFLAKGLKPTSEQVDAWIQTYASGMVVHLFSRNLKTDERKWCRSVIYDAFEGARKKFGTDWSDVKLAAMGMKPPAGCEWIIAYEDTRAAKTW